MNQNRYLKMTLIGRKTIYYYVLLTIWLIGISAGALSVIYSEHKYFTFLITYFAISFFIWIVGNLFIKKYIITGELELYPDVIFIKEFNSVNKFDIRDIDQLSITYYGKKGDSYGPRFGLFRVKDGANNFISFIYKGNYYNYQFLVLSPNFINSLKVIVREWLKLNHDLTLTVLNEYKENITL